MTLSDLDGASVGANVYVGAGIGLSVAVQDFDPGLAFPDVQGVHEVDRSTLENVSTPQYMHSRAPRTELYWPAAQPAQDSSEAPPASGLAVPSGQAVHMEAPPPAL